MHLLHRIARLGWIEEPSPITLIERAHLGLLAVKRDDLLAGLHGGSKTRKLDYLLAAEPFARAPGWHSVGATGSGHLVALAAAAHKLERALYAHCFWSKGSAHTLDNLAFTASAAQELHYYRSRWRAGLCHPGLVWGNTRGGLPIIPPGASNVRGMTGLVHAGLELAAQIRAGVLPAPERIYLPLGTGGTTAGLAVGLALSGMRPTLHAVAAVERVFSLESRLNHMMQKLIQWLVAQGVREARECVLPPIVIDRSQVGRGYGAPTQAALSACVDLAQLGIHLEPVYTGKAMAALLADAQRAKLGATLFWLTAHRGPLPHDPAWRERLPKALAQRLAQGESRARRFSRRRVLVGAGAGALAVALYARLSGYPALAGWQGSVLSAREAHILRAATEALLPPAPDAGAYAKVALNVDRFLSIMPEPLQLEIHALLALAEHATFLGLRLHRLTALSPPEREAYLARLAEAGGQLALAYRGLRDLCLLGYYQEPSTWAGLGYPGRALPPSYDARGDGRAWWPNYESLRAGPGVLPKGAAG